MIFKYTANHIAFLRSGYIEMQIPELTSAFNTTFLLYKTEGQIKSALQNRKITCGRKPGNPKGAFRIFNPVQAAFLVDKYKELSIVDLHVAFNRHFNEEKTEAQIRSFVKNHKIKSGRSGQFEKGAKPWNAGTKGLVSVNSGCFKEGSVPKNRRPLGSERTCSKDGYLLIKVAEVNPYNGQKTRYKAKHTVTWEEHNGPIPKGMVLIFLDCNKLNCAIENLALVSRPVLLYLNRKGYQDLPAALRPNLLALAKLETKTFSLAKADTKD